MYELRAPCRSFTIVTGENREATFSSEILRPDGTQYGHWPHGKTCATCWRDDAPG